MKKFLNEFKEFAMKGNVLDLAIAVVLGAAFGKVVSSLVDIFIQPLVDAVNHAISPEVDAATIPGKLVGFAGVLIEFILVAFVLFLIVTAANKMQNLKKKEEEAPAEPPTKECPYCLSEVPIKATRCPHCTSEIK
jgi:large conductance mechanosensitive channel